MMEAQLVVVSGAKPVRLSLRLPTVIGRSAESTLKVRQAHVSRRHCKLYEYKGELAVRDLGSSNGTFVNGQRIDGPVFLQPGDQLRVGSVTLRADYEFSPQPDDCLKESSSDVDRQLNTEQSSAVLQYRESDEGSFIFIDGDQAVDCGLETGEEQPPRIESDDSDLKNFLDNLE